MDAIKNVLTEILSFLRYKWKDREYTVEFSFYSGAQINSLKANCNEITFLNTGTCNVVIQNVYTLAPGSPLAINGNKNEVDVTTYKFFFQGAGTQALLVARKIYLK